MPKQSKTRAKAVGADQREIERGLRDGELSIGDVYEMCQHEHRETFELDRAETAHLRGVGEKPARKVSDVRHVAGPLTLRRVVAAASRDHADLILSEYDLDDALTLDEIGSAEASLLDSAVRLVTHTPRPDKARKR